MSDAGGRGDQKNMTEDKSKPKYMLASGKKLCHLTFNIVIIKNEYMLRRKKMKSLLLSFILLIGISMPFSAYSLEGDGKQAEAKLNNIDAIQAMAIANQWKWSKKNIKSYVTPREVVFKFSNGKIKKIPLPKEKMLVAVAPYVNRTHK
jgi:hypothetical protein